MSLEPGAPAPAFALPADDGRTVALADVAGRKLVLYFYPKDDTSGCTREAIDFNGMKDDFAKAGATYISVGAITHSAPALDIGLDLD